MPFEFDPNATPLPRIEALEKAVNELADAPIGTAPADGQTEALQLVTAAIKDLDQRHKDLFAMFKALEARLSPAPAPGTTAPVSKTTVDKTTAAKTAA